jgi:hypothetical protein
MPEFPVMDILIIAVSFCTQRISFGGTPGFNDLPICFKEEHPVIGIFY